jgi:hypothetical protein
LPNQFLAQLAEQRCGIPMAPIDICLADDFKVVLR